MKTVCLAVILALHFSAARADDFRVASAESTFLKTNYDCVLVLSRLKSAPKWDGESAPPLSAKAAQSAATSTIFRQLGNLPSYPFILGDDLPGWRVGRTTLVQHLDTGMWYYRIEATPVVPGSSSYPAVTVFVTLDGQAVPLTTKKP